MTFLAILFALLFEQVRPLGAHSSAHRLARLWVTQILRSFDAGKKPAAYLAWGLMVLLPALLATGAHDLLLASGNWLGWALLFALHVTVLYLTLGFRQFSAYFTSIRDALDAGDEAGARSVLAKWSVATPMQDLPSRGDILRRVLAQAGLSAHIHVFGVMVAYGLGALLGLGPAGAVLYRLCELVARYCSHQMQNRPANDQHPISAPMQALAQGAWLWLDWLPTRISALLFAIVGNFEDAIASWRAQVHSRQSLGAAHTPTPEDNAQLLISAAAGAIGVQMSMDAQEALPESNLSEPQLGHLQAMVGLVWRAVVVWMVLLALLTVAGMA